MKKLDFMETLVGKIEMKNNYRLEKVDHLLFTEEDWKNYS